MKKILLFLLLLIVACEKSDDVSPFKQGTFEIPAGKNYSKTIITRTGNLHIETYTTKVIDTVNGKIRLKNVTQSDTLYIKWSDNKSYTLQKKGSNSLKNIIFVEMENITPNSYNFIARYGYSKSAQKGIIYKIK